MPAGWYAEFFRRLVVETTGAPNPTRRIQSAGGTYLLRRRASHACALAPERPPSSRVLRGGSWNNNPQNLRSANRNRNQPDNRNNNVGFRVASTLCAGAIAITIAMGAHDKRSGPFMMTTVGARVELGARYRGGACPGRRTGSRRRRRFRSIRSAALAAASSIFALCESTTPSRCCGTTTGTAPKRMREPSSHLTRNSVGCAFEKSQPLGCCDAQSLSGQGHKQPANDVRGDGSFLRKPP
jgi:hypothetical protein